VNSSIFSSRSAALLQGEAGARLNFIGALLVTMAVCLAAAWSATIWLREGFLEQSYPMWKIKYQMAAQCRTADTVVIGDSRSVAGFIPGIIPDTVNYGLGGGTPIDIYYLIRRVMACPHKPKRVLMSFSMDQLAEDPWFWRSSALFGFMSFADLEEVRRRSRALGDTSIFAPPTFLDIDAMLNDWLYAKHFPSFYVGPLLRGGLIGRLAMNRRIAAETDQALGHHGFGTDAGCDQVSPDAAIRSFVPSPINDDYLRRTLALLTGNGADVEFISAPVNAATYAALSPVAAAQYRYYILSLARDVPHFRVVGDPLSHWDNRWFGDYESHLNEDGARRFSAQVVASIFGPSVSAR